jgi:hypothetical protein
MPTQMGEFDFISVLISLIIGLGMTNLLSGAGRAFYRRQKSPIDEVHMVLTAATLLILVLNWWVTFSWRAETNWTFEKFLVLIIWIVSLFMLTIFLYPPDLSESEEHRDIWLQNRLGSTALLSSCAFSTSCKQPYAAACSIQSGIPMLVITLCSAPPAWPASARLRQILCLVPAHHHPWPGHFSSGVFFSKPV